MPDEGKHRVETLTVNDERLRELRKTFEIFGQTFSSPSFVPFPGLGVNNQKDRSINETVTFHHPHWTPFPTACIECATSPQLISSEINHGSSSQETFSLLPCSFKTNQDSKVWDESFRLYPEPESLDKMKTHEIDSSPDLFGQFSSENKKFQPKQRTFPFSNTASKVLFPEISSDQTENLSENQEINSAEKPVRSCPLCQEIFPTQMPQLDIDGHIARCLSATADDDIIW